MAGHSRTPSWSTTRSNRSIRPASERPGPRVARPVRDGPSASTAPPYAGPETVVSPDLVERAYSAFQDLDWTNPELRDLQNLFLRAARVGAELVERGLRAGIRHFARVSVAPVLDEDGGPGFPVAQVGPRALAPAALPKLDGGEQLLVAFVPHGVPHLVLEVVRNSLQVETILRKQKVITR